MKNECPDFLQEEVPLPVVPTNDELSQVHQLAVQQLHLQEEVAHLEAELASAKERLERIQNVALPEAMLSLGLSKFTLTSGATVSIKEDVMASIKADYIDGAVAWLDKIGCGDVVKDEIKVNLSRGEAELAARFMALAYALNVKATEKLSVHPQTLKALVKEQRTKGVVFPDALFSIFDFRKAIIK